MNNNARRELVIPWKNTWKDLRLCSMTTTVQKGTAGKDNTEMLTTPVFKGWD